MNKITMSLDQVFNEVRNTIVKDRSLENMAALGQYCCHELKDRVEIPANCRHFLSIISMVLFAIENAESNNEETICNKFIDEIDKFIVLLKDDSTGKKLN